ncbi:MAG: glycosyltransferase [Kiritimatiellae bacterium]|nr:glycosyltransferase [Kiritimatiellia bacterium]
MQAGPPTFSIVLPTYRRPQPLRRCLEALSRLDYPRERFEVLVVDDGSDESPEPIVSEVSGTISTRLIQQDHAGPARARNRGAAEASGRFLAFTDDDCEPETGWLKAFEVALQGEPHTLAGGTTVDLIVNRPCSQASQALIDYLYAYANQNHGGPAFFTSNNIATERTAFLDIGGFDPSFPLAAAEDRDLCDRWRAKGWPMRVAPDARIGHAHDLNLGAFVRQHFNYGRGAYQFHRRRATRSDKPIRVEPLAFYTGLLAFPFKRPGQRRRMTVAILLLASQLANAAGFFHERFHSRRSSTRTP